MASTTRRVFASISCLLALLLISLAGAVTGMLVNANTPVIYRSSSIFQIAPNWIAGENVSGETVDRIVELLDQPHETTLSSPSFLEECLEQNNLFVLDSFVDLSKEECFPKVLDNLTIEQIAEDGIYKLTLLTNNPQDSATLVNNMVRQFANRLKQDHPELTSHYTFRVLEVGRIGEQTWPILPINLFSGLFAGFLFTAIMWFLINPFRLQPPRFSLRELGILTAVLVSLMTVAFFTAQQLTKVREYETTSRIQIVDRTLAQAMPNRPPETRLVELARTPHEHLLNRYIFIDSALNRSGLYDVDTLAEMSKEEAIEHIQNRMDIESEADDTYLLRFQADTPQDSQILLDSLIDNYLESLKSSNRKRLQAQEMRADPEKYELTEDLEYGIAKQFETKVLQPASTPVPVTRSPLNIIPGLMAAALVALLVMLVYLTWRASRDADSELNIVDAAVVT